MNTWSKNRTQNRKPKARFVEQQQTMYLHVTELYIIFFREWNAYRA